MTLAISQKNAEDFSSIAGAACICELVGRSILHLSSGVGLLLGAISAIAKKIIHDRDLGPNVDIPAFFGTPLLTAVVFSACGIPISPIQACALLISAIAGEVIGLCAFALSSRPR
jgi:hypothetical protein